MPIYEYKCKDCGEVFEAIQKFSDKPLTKCTSCSGSVERLISQSAFHLKGGGWYADGYSSKKGEDSPKKPSCTGCPSNDS